MHALLRNSSLASAVSFISTFNTFSLLPIVASYGERGAVDMVVGIAAFVGVRALVIAILTLPAGFIVDRLGLRASLLISIPIKSAGTLILLLGNIEHTTTVAALLLGLGTALGKPALKSYIANLGPQKQVTRLFSVQALSINLGIAIAPFSAQVAISTGNEVLMVASLLAVEAASTIFLSLTATAAEKSKVLGERHHFRRLLNSSFAILVTQQFFIGFCMALCLTALMTGQFRGDTTIINSAGLLISLQSVALVGLQLLASMRTVPERWFLPALSAIFAATVCVTHGSMPILIMGLFLLASAEVVLIPLLNARVASIFPELRGTAYSVLAMAEAIADSAAALFISQIASRDQEFLIDVFFAVGCLAIVPIVATSILYLQRSRLKARGRISREAEKRFIP